MRQLLVRTIIRHSFLLQSLSPSSRQPAPCCSYTVNAPVLPVRLAHVLVALHHQAHQPVAHSGVDGAAHLAAHTHHIGPVCAACEEWCRWNEADEAELAAGVWLKLHASSNAAVCRQRQQPAAHKSATTASCSQQRKTPAPRASAPLPSQKPSVMTRVSSSSQAALEGVQMRMRGLV